MLQYIHTLQRVVRVLVLCMYVHIMCNVKGLVYSVCGVCSVQSVLNAICRASIGSVSSLIYTPLFSPVVIFTPPPPPSSCQVMTELQQHGTQANAITYGFYNQVCTYVCMCN